MTGHPSDKRQYTRIVVKRPVQFLPIVDDVSCMGVEDGMLWDLSETGALITVTLPRELYDYLHRNPSPCHLRFRDEPGLPRRVHARTVWLRSIIAAKDKLTCRMGLQFEDVDPAERAKIRLYLEHAAAEQGLLLQERVLEGVPEPPTPETQSDV